LTQQYILSTSTIIMSPYGVYSGCRWWYGMNGGLTGGHILQLSRISSQDRNPT